MHLIIQLIFISLQCSYFLSLRNDYFRVASRKSTELCMSDLVLSGNPTIEEWLEICDSGLKRTTLGMFKACKEIAYKIRTASCNKIACFNEFGNTVGNLSHQSSCMS